LRRVFRMALGCRLNTRPLARRLQPEETEANEDFAQAKRGCLRKFILIVAAAVFRAFWLR
jgi:hypothetical protein